jgi:hypothetical protein
VVGAVAGALIAAVLAEVAVVARAGAQPDPGEQLALARLQDPLGARGLDERRAQPERVELIRS